MTEKTKAPRKPRAPKAVAGEDHPSKPKVKGEERRKRVTALQRARLKATAATVPHYAVRGPLATALLSSPSPLAVALATSSYREARKLIHGLKYAVQPHRKRPFQFA